MGEIAVLIKAFKTGLLIPAAAYLAKHPGEFATGILLMVVVFALLIWYVRGQPHVQSQEEGNMQLSEDTITWSAQPPQSAMSGEYHILTFAETGFAMLNVYGTAFGLGSLELNKFAEDVNRRDELGSLYPKAPISALPRAYVRDRLNAEELSDKIMEFLQANRTKIRAPRLVVDFRAGVAPFVLEAVKRAFKSPFAEGLEHVVVIDRN